MELPKVYAPEETEKRWYPVWEEQGLFRPNSDLRNQDSEKLSEPRALSSDSFCIVIPPPNVTGSLHMGHALNNTLQDILTRWHRMAGQATLWVPGTDHGGIATQNVVEKLLKAEKKTRHDLGREAFLERMWQWRKESGDTILMQLKRLGASCDWSRTRFTMDEVCSRAVRHAFVQLFNKGLIYRGPRMVNWCPRCHTALSDIEVEHEDKAGKLWHIKYLLASGKGEVIVATTRPETMLGDTAVAVNPEDPRYKSLIGQKLKLPLTSREIPIVADAAVDAAFGTGAVKVTPAHDQTDFEIGERHKLPHVVVISFEGKMTKEAGTPYAGLDRFEARKKIVDDLEAQGLLEKTDDYKLSAAICYRCQTIVEPLVSEQWFMKMSGLAERAAQATRDGRMKIVPSSWEKPYLLWLDNIKDWCISRQIWWGHRIPVYYCGKGCKPFASAETPTECTACKGKTLKQDDDVLDTWFSSGLWPMSVFHWPDQTPELKTFYPTSVLVTGHEILYLWVARMVMMGLEFMNEVPFKHVYIHGIVRDKQGKKMSKSLGNVIDPLDIMKQYGTDALRMSLAESSIPGRDMQLSQDSFLKARNFANKLWNASRFVFMNLTDYKPTAAILTAESPLADRWIMNELEATIQHVTESLEGFNPAEAARTLYEFVWSSFCDWYVEVAKIRFQGTDTQAKAQAQSVIVHVLDNVLAMLHPIMPYETEEIYTALKPFLAQSSESLMIRSWPQTSAGRKDPTATQQFKRFQEVVTTIRTVRSEMNVQPGKPIVCEFKSRDSELATTLHQLYPELRALAKLESETLHIHSDIARPKESAVAVAQGAEIFVHLKDLVDLEKEKARLTKKITELKQFMARSPLNLKRDDFVKHAKPETVEMEKTNLKVAEEKIALYERNLSGF